MDQRSMLLMADSRCNVPEAAANRHLAIKPAEVVWNGMKTLDEAVTHNRTLFQGNAEINLKTSGPPADIAWRWADFIADQSVDHDTLFLYHPEKTLFPLEMEDLVTSTVTLKSRYSEFLKQHGKDPKRIKLSLIDSGTWFGGLGLGVWQGLAYLKQIADQPKVSLSALKQRLQQLAQRSAHISLVNSREAHRAFLQLGYDTGWLARLSSGWKRDSWYGFCVCHGQIKAFDPASFEQQAERVLGPLLAEAERGRLAFPRVLLSGGGEGNKRLARHAAWQSFTAQKKSAGFQVVAQPASLTEQILMGQNSVHISFVTREGA